MRWALVLGLILLAGLGIWLIPQNRDDDDIRAEAVGTSGTHAGSAETHLGDVITEVETITGATDGMILVGRRVDLHVDVQERATDRAFWVGSPDNRLLVVLRRDHRDGKRRQQVRPSNHGVVPVHGGQRAAVAGVVRAAPDAEHRHGWNLTRDDERELGERKIYIDADTVHPQGHGTL